MQRVTAAVIERGGRVLIAQRGQDDPLAGMWEFPGGKVEPGETPEACLARELSEEFGISAEVGELFCRSTNDDPVRPIELLAYKIVRVSGEFTLREHAQIAWVEPHELAAYHYPHADLAIVERLQKGSSSD